MCSWGRLAICPTRHRRQSSRMSASRSPCVCTKTSLAPGAAAANSSATRALRYFCCVVTTIRTSQNGRIRRSRASVVLAGIEAFVSLACLAASPGKPSIFAIRRIRVGAIDENQVCKRRRILLDKIDFRRRNAEHFGRQSGSADDRRAERRWSVAAGADEFGPGQGVDQ